MFLYGDDFDLVIWYNKLISIVGDVGYDLLLFLNCWINCICCLFGGNYWFLVFWIKVRVYKVCEVIDVFEKVVIYEVKK